MKLSVVILNYNVRHFLELCLRSVKAATSDIPSEIIVVDNASEDDSCDMVKTFFPEVKLVENKQNLGFSKGNNIGVSKAQGEYLCILNPDTVVAEDTFSELLKLYNTKDDLGIIGCKLIDGSGTFLPESKRNIPVVKAAFKKMIGDSKYYYANHVSENGAGDVDVLVGAFMFVKKDVYDVVQGFDEDYFMYGEDIDLSYKVLKQGYKNYYFGGTSVIHFKGESTLKDKNYARRFYGAMQIFYRKHFKRNYLFDALVWLGIRMAYVFRKHAKLETAEVNVYRLVSKEINPKLQSVLGKEIVLDSDLETIQPNNEIIFDTNHISYKKMISLMQDLSVGKKLTFKILPKDSSFIIGSNDSKGRGQIITF
ncbi:glycosyltransferase family 2 protein [Seonamhaeicola sp. ML3]|uniref:glycosyltransferase family 2 protein n=1 Tax=Seonamhaeicola sp. ML3 TaxID=2937786 RepID=UPI002010B07A|nr:glycosyltransferase family 2 protein [Seonamhaeicola sp. ML3]